MPDNLSGATKKSIHDARVANLDNFGANPAEFIEQEGMNIIENIVGDFIERVHQNINSIPNFVTTGAINDITINAENGSINVMAHKHLIYQDRGVSGTKVKYDTPHAYTDKMPPVDVFIAYIKDKGLKLRDNEKYSYKKPPFKELSDDKLITRAAWGMAKNVFYNGIKPKNIFQKEYPQLIEDLTEQIADFTVHAITQMIDVKPSAKRIITP